MLFMLKKNKYIVLILEKHISNSEKQVILLMIPNGEFPSFF